MNQNQPEKIFAPENNPAGELKRPEVPETPEFELPKEQPETEIEKNEEAPSEEAEQSSVLPTAKKKKYTPPPPARDSLTIKVEEILSSGLEDTYRSLPPLTQQEFKLKGEQAASKIREMMRSAKIHVKKIFKLIVAWLSMLPGVNRFFLEQEAKIKTDKIIELKKRESEKTII